jgi:hypothetical protein
MTYEFEKFESTGGSYTPKISVRSNGALGFSQGALRRFGLWDGDWYIQLYFDKKHNVIGIEPSTTAGAGKAHLVKKKIQGKDGRQTVNAYVAAKAFFDFYGIDYSETRPYLVKREEGDAKIILQLQSTNTPSTPASPENEGGNPT